MTPDSGWTKVYFTHRSPKGCLSPTGDLTVKGLFAVLAVLYLEGNYGPVCQKGLALYSNSDKSFAGRYYELSEADVDVLHEAAADGLLRVTSKGDVGVYVDFTDDGLRYVLNQPVPPALAAILGETDVSFLTSAARDVGAVYELVKGFEEALIKARSLNASEFTFHNVVSILHKLMLDPKSALEHLARQHSQKIRGKPIENNCSLFDLYVGRNARVLNSFKQGMFMSVTNSTEGSDYRLGKWHGGYNPLGDFQPAPLRSQVAFEGRLARLQALRSLRRRVRDRAVTGHPPQQRSESQFPVEKNVNQPNVGDRQQEPQRRR